jgi:ornithine decarboxylase
VLVDSLTYLYSALTLRRIDVDEPPPRTGVTARGLLRDVVDGVRWVYLDAGVFTGLVETVGEGIRYRIQAMRDIVPLAGGTAPAVLAGPTCDSLDILYERYRYRLPLDLRPGDRLRFLSAGAYTASYSSVGFNGFAPLREEYR